MSDPIYFASGTDENRIRMTVEQAEKGMIPDTWTAAEKKKVMLAVEKYTQNLLAQRINHLLGLDPASTIVGL